jgi:anti-sigma B factor antagonist
VELKVTTRPAGAQVVVSVHGEIDLYTAPRLHQELSRAQAGDAPRRLIVDLSGVDFCDSTGANVLLAAHRRAAATGGELALAAPRPVVVKILNVTGLDTVFRVVDVPKYVAGS